MIGAAVAQPAERGGGLGAHLVLEVAQAAHEHREGARGRATSPSTLAAQARAGWRPGCSSKAISGSTTSGAVAREDVGDARARARPRRS